MARWLPQAAREDDKGFSPMPKIRREDDQGSRKMTPWLPQTAREDDNGLTPDAKVPSREQACLPQDDPLAAPGRPRGQKKPNN